MRQRIECFTCTAVVEEEREKKWNKIKEEKKDIKEREKDEEDSLFFSKGGEAH